MSQDDDIADQLDSANAEIDRWEREAERLKSELDTAGMEIHRLKSMVEDEPGELVTSEPWPTNTIYVAPDDVLLLPWSQSFMDTGRADGLEEKMGIDTAMVPGLAMPWVLRKLGADAMPWVLRKLGADEVNTLPDEDEQQPSEENDESREYCGVPHPTNVERVGCAKEPGHEGQHRW